MNNWTKIIALTAGIMCAFSFAGTVRGGEKTASLTLKPGAIVRLNAELTAVN